MLTDDQLSLVSAAVDRELSPAQVGTFQALIRTSAEAGQLFRQLSEQSARLGKLPRLTAPPDFQAAVLARIDPPAVPSASPWFAPRWLPVAVAASALTAVTVWAVNRSATGPAVAEVVPAPVIAKPEPTRPEPQPELTPEPPKVAPAPTTEAAPVPKAVVAGRPPPKRRNVVVEEPTPDPLGAPVYTPPPLAQAEVRLPYLAALADLDQADAQTRLVAELGRDGPVRLDLFARDTLRGVQVLTAVAKQAGLTVAVDAVARDRMARKLPTPAYAVYTDSLTADDAAKLVAALAVFDRRPDQGIFAQAHVVPLRDADRRDIRELLGADPDAPRRPRDKAADALKVKPGEKTGVMVVYLPPGLRTNPLLSKEVRDYLTRRDDRKPGAVSLLVTVRAVGP